MIYLNQISQFIYRNLGDRLTQQPGFINRYSSAILNISLITPFVFETIKLIFECKVKQCIIVKKNLNISSICNFKLCLDKQSGSELKNNFLKILKQNSIALAASFFVLTLFGLFKENPFAVITGYISILLSNIYKAIETYQTKSKSDFIKYSLNSCITAAAIGAMLFGLYETRWHHMSYGLLCLLFDFRTVNFFGACMTADSMLYWLRPLKDNYDFSNIFIDNVYKFLFQLTVLTTYEITHSILKKETKRRGHTLLR